MRCNKFYIRDVCIRYYVLCLRYYIMIMKYFVVIMGNYYVIMRYYLNICICMIWNFVYMFILNKNYFDLVVIGYFG